VFFTRRPPDFSRSIGVHRGNAEPNDESGQAECVWAVTNPAAMIAMFAIVSLRAERKAARVRLPLCARKRASMNAQDRLVAKAPRPASVMGTGAAASAP